MLSRKIRHRTKKPNSCIWTVELYPFFPQANYETRLITPHISRFPLTLFLSPFLPFPYIPDQSISITPINGRYRAIYPLHLVRSQTSNRLKEPTHELAL